MPATYTIEGGYKKLVLDDGAKCDVVAALDLSDGQSVKLIPSQKAVLDAIAADALAIKNLQNAPAARLLNASDLVQSYTYLDAGTANQRISTVVYSSGSMSLTMTETYAYAGSVGNYYLTSITRVVS